MFTKSDIEKYFMAEKNLGLLFIILGAVAVLASFIFFFVMKTNWHKGVALPFIIIGLLQLIIGFNVYKNSDKHRISVVYAYDMNPAELKKKELSRMEKVQDSFKLILSLEVLLLAVGIALFLYFKNDPQKIFWAGVGIALAIQAMVCLFADLNAFNRATNYKKGLTEYLNR
jgi:membrane protein YdbS with pleckstrin-like domain